MSKTIVLAAGTFDVFHDGHKYFLAQARALGDELVVVVARDANVERLKGFAPHWNEERRRQAVEGSVSVDRAILGYEEWGRHLDVLNDIEPQVIALGYDQQIAVPEGEWDIVRLPAYEPEQFKSSVIRERLSAQKPV